MPISAVAKYVRRAKGKEVGGNQGWFDMSKFDDENDNEIYDPDEIDQEGASIDDVDI